MMAFLWPTVILFCLNRELVAGFIPQPPSPQLMDTDNPNSENDANAEEQLPPAPISARAAEAGAVPSPSSVPFEFSGDTGEYFKIWIVNLLLSVVTLGFYWPWATVRSRRYLYANTRLDGHAFDYLAKPKSLLIGYIVVLFFFALYVIAGIFNPLFVYPVLLVYGIAAPWMIFKALRFRSRNTAYRNIRFKFSGHLSDSYATFLGWAILVPFTFGLIIPYWEMKKKEYFFDNLQFGKTYFNFKAKPGEYYKYYLLFFAIGMGLYFILLFLIFGGMAIFGDGFGAMQFNAADETFSTGIVIGMAIAYIVVIAAMVIFQQGLWLKLFNYNMSVWSMGKFRFESRMQFWTFIGIAVTNLFASIFTLGMLIPWAQIRMTKYRLENMYVLAPGGDMGEHFEAESEEEGAFGEAATDFMDFEVGL